MRITIQHNSQGSIVIITPEDGEMRAPVKISIPPNVQLGVIEVDSCPVGIRFVTDMKTLQKDLVEFP